MIDNLSTQITCPACKSINISTSTAGMVFKKTIHTCTSCGTTLEQSGKEDDATYRVTKVGEEYSNAASLLEGKGFVAHNLRDHGLNVLPDSQLEAFANGDLDNLNIQMVGDISLNIILKKDERVIFYLSPIDYLEERSKQVSSGGGGFSFRVTKGVWYRTPSLSSPQYANVIQAIDNGYLVFTNRRYIFMGSRKNIDQPYTKVTSIKPFKDGVGIARANKQRTEMFSGRYHWPLIISVITGLVRNAAGS